MNDIIERIVARSGVDLNNIQEDEYIKEGKIYCKKCKTPRSCFVFGDRLVRCICECQTKERDEQEQREKEYQRLKEVEKLKKASLIGEKYVNASFDTTEIGYSESFDSVFTRCKRYCEVADKVYSEGMGIYLYGTEGNGKTHLTACMANYLLNQRYQVLFTNFFEISKMIRGTFNSAVSAAENESDYINKLATIDFLFIDDLGTEKVTKGEEDTWLQGVIFDILNKRYNMKKPTIFTSNYSLAQLINDRGIMKKTVDRIAEMSTVVLKNEGDNYRLRKRAKVEIPF